MKVETSTGNTYFIDWRHEESESKALSKFRTTCYIKDKDFNPIDNDYAFCSIKDNFCKAIGRKISLARALMIFDKPIRKEIWEAYLSRKDRKFVKVIKDGKALFVDSDELQKGDIVHTVEDGDYKKVSLGNWVKVEEVKDGTNN